jgi:hypothetical protein
MTSFLTVIDVYSNFWSNQVFAEWFRKPTQAAIHWSSSLRRASQASPRPVTWIYCPTSFLPTRGQSFSDDQVVDFSAAGSVSRQRFQRCTRRLAWASREARPDRRSPWPYDTASRVSTNTHVGRERDCSWAQTATIGFIEVHIAVTRNRENVARYSRFIPNIVSRQDVVNHKLGSLFAITRPVWSGVESIYSEMPS